MACIWCPGCGCDVSTLLIRETREIQRRHAQAKAEQRALHQLVRRVRTLVQAMEAHAQEKADVQRSVPEIYRLWSDELLAELNARFPGTSTQRSEPT